MPEDGDAVRVLVRAEQEGPAGVELEVPRRLALGVAVVHDAKITRLAAPGGLLDGEHRDAVVAAVADQHEAVRLSSGNGGQTGRGALVCCLPATLSPAKQQKHKNKKGTRTRQKNPQRKTRPSTLSQETKNKTRTCPWGPRRFFRTC